MPSLRQVSRIVFVLLLLAHHGCGGGDQVAPPRPVPRDRARAASQLTQRYAGSRLHGWRVRARAAGSDCAVLVIDIGIVMEDSMVEALHYGAAAYALPEGGVQRYSRKCAFRGVAYKDSSGRIWTYGGVSEREVAALVPCA